MDNSVTPRYLSSLYQQAHNSLRDNDGLQPQEAFDELLKFLFFKQCNEQVGPRPSIVGEVASDGTSTEVPLRITAEIRCLFGGYVEEFNSWLRGIWSDREFNLSDRSVLTLYRLFRDVEFSNVSFDVRSAALREFLSPEMRRGLGIYLTPDDVVRMMVEFVDPSASQSVFDPACGSGTFLAEALQHRMCFTGDLLQNVVWGTDKNPRMLLLAVLNMGHYEGIEFERRLVDALFPEYSEDLTWPVLNSFDVIFTNPPFGVSLDSSVYDLRAFRTCRDRKGKVIARQSSEIVFVEQCLRYLKPGGTLGIVLPKSVVTNLSFLTARQALDQLGYVYAIVTLPAETFAVEGTQATTVVLFARKYRVGEDRAGEISIALSEVSNVGYDSTGRPREDNQLHGMAHDLRLCVESGETVGTCKSLPKVKKASTFSEIDALLSGRRGRSTKYRLSDVVERVSMGRTPKRSNYTDEGLFLVKVGNLTGRGINWIPRERNFIDGVEAMRRLSNDNQTLREHDILLTCAAHSPKYIAKKVDIVGEIPEWVGGRASFVAEVMLIRPNIQIISPFVLLAYLRALETTGQIQKMIRGQTAHLYPSDLLELPVPEKLLQPDERVNKVAEVLHSETRLSRELNDIVFQQRQVLEDAEFWL